MANTTGDNGGGLPEFVPGTPTQYQDAIRAAAQKWGVSTLLLSAILKQESNFNPTAVSPAGAVGIAQFMPGTAAGLGVNPWDANSSIDGAAHYLSNLHTQFSSWQLAVAAYNAGPGAVQSAGNQVPAITETQRYVEGILNLIGGDWSALGDAGSSGSSGNGSTSPSQGGDAITAFINQVEGGITRIALTGAGVLVAVIGLTVLILGGVRGALKAATHE